MTDPDSQLEIAALKGHVLHLAEAIARYPENEYEKTRALTLVAVQLLGALSREDRERDAVAWNLHATLLAERFWLGVNSQ